MKGADLKKLLRESKVLKCDKIFWSSCISFFLHPTMSIERTAFLQFLQVFIGLSFPYEGPGPLEAIAQGSVFINPKVGI